LGIHDRLSGTERFLVTGCMGCIGAWVTKTLIGEGAEVIGFDLGAEPDRLRLIATEEEIGRVQFVSGDVSDAHAIERIVADQGVTNIVHLAALQTPACRANPVLGATVNVAGAVNVFEVVAAHREQIHGFAYASSGAVFGPPSMYPDELALDGSPLAPGASLYAVYKQANEWTATVYAETRGIGSIGLRPFIVYGPGRDQGLSSAPTIAMLSAAAGQPYRLTAAGRAVFQYAEDVAKCFVAASRIRTTRAHHLNIGGPRATLADVVAAIEAAVPGSRDLIVVDDAELPPAVRVDDAGLRDLIGDICYVALEEGVRRTIHAFRDLLARGLVKPPAAATQVV
jgi:nucleoside-diphosphate-sugar epimerase